MNALKKLLGKIAGGAPSGPPARLVVAIAGLAGGAYVVSNCIVTIKPGHVGLMYNALSGLNDKSTMGEGFHLVVPWFQRAIIFDTRTKPSIIHIASGSKGDFKIQLS